MGVAHRTWYARGENITECHICGEDWYFEKDEPPMFTRLWTPVDAQETTRLSQSVWGVRCDICGSSYAQINLYGLSLQQDQDNGE